MEGRKGGTAEGRDSHMHCFMCFFFVVFLYVLQQFF